MIKIRLLIFISIISSSDYLMSTLKNKIKYIYRYPKLPIALIFLVFCYKSQAQYSCYDLDFESGTLQGWTTTGNVVIDSVGNDFYGGFPVSAPGGNYSARVGSKTDNTESSISKSFTVTSANPILTYRYAMDILNYPHTPNAAALITIDLLDNVNSSLQCGHYEAFYATGGTQDFLISSQPEEGNPFGQCCFGISYQPWRSLSIDLTPYIGQTLTVKATCEWCVFNTDWAYAYFDFGCTNFEIQQDTSFKCNALGTLLIAPKDFESYSWTGPGIVSGQTNDSAFVNQTGNYTVNMLTATGCAISKTVLVTVIVPVISVFVAGDTSVCELEQSVLTASGGVIYQWLNSADTTNTITISPTVTTNHSVIVTDTNGCSDTASIKVIVNSKPQANFNPNDVCLNFPTLFTDQSVTTNGTITSWAWNFGDGSPTELAQNPNHLYLIEGGYTINFIVATNYGCIDTAVGAVMVHTLPNADFVANNVCDGSPVEFEDLSTITGTDTIQFWTWDFGDASPLSNNQSPTHIYGTGGTYSTQLIVVSDFGCSDSVSKTFTINPNPIITFTTSDGDTSVCELAQTVLTASGGLIYQWLSSSDITSAITISPTTTTSYSVIVTDTNSCSDTASITIFINSKPQASFIPNDVCLNFPTLFTDQSSVTNGTITSWSWNFGDGSPINLIQNPNHLYLSEGVYTINFIVTSNFGCIDTVTGSVMVHPLPDADFETSNVCDGTPVGFEDLSTITGTDMIQFWSWDFGDGSPLLNNQNPVHIYDSGGTYSTQLIVVSDFGCTDSVSKTFKINPNPIVNFTAADTVGCSPICVNFQNLSAITSGNNISYFWEMGDGSPAQYLLNASHCFYNSSNSASQQFNISLTVTSDSGCITKAVKINNIIVNPNPLASFYTLNQSTSIIDPIVFYSNLSIGASSWDWDFGDLSGSLLENPISHTYNDTGMFVNSLTVKNSFNCYDTAYQKVWVNQDWVVYIPNSFSPNRDNQNETFQAFGSGIITYEMSILDRWGKEVYHTVSYDYPWDGRAKNGEDIAQADVYVYIINIKDIYGIDHTFNGIVNLIK